MRPRASAPATESRGRSRRGGRTAAVPTPVRDTDDGGRVVPPRTRSSGGAPIAEGRGTPAAGLHAPCREDAGTKTEVGEGGSRSGMAGRRRALAEAGRKKGCVAVTADAAARRADRPRPTAKGRW